jgi:uncharacterized membrane protein
LIILPAVYLSIIYKDLPSTIPTHYGLNGPDKFGNKSESWTTVFIITPISVFIYFILKNLSAIDPKKYAAVSIKLVDKILFIVITFFSLLQLIIINASLGNDILIQKGMLPLLSLFFCLLGNAMINIKPNYFIGIRTPWTLESEANWKATHRLGGKLWFWGGIVLTPLTFIIPFKIAVFIFLFIILVVTIIPIIFSYLFFKKQTNNAD